MTAILYHQITSLDSVDFNTGDPLKNNSGVEGISAGEILNLKEAGLKKII